MDRRGKIDQALAVNSGGIYSSKDYLRGQLAVGSEKDLHQYKAILYLK